MKLNELKTELERLENRLFLIQMEDFMDWTAFYKVRGQIDEVKNAIAAIEA
jgi:hypothetical protein